MPATDEPIHLVWAREILAASQAGLMFTRDPYDAERYQALRSLSARMLADLSGSEPGRFSALLSNEAGYPTHKVDVRGAVFDDRDRILMVREALDNQLWTLPGGGAEMNQTAAQSVIREVFEESGYTAKVIKVASVWGMSSQGHPPSLFSYTKLFFICKLVGGSSRPSLETTEVAWFSEQEVPSQLSTARVLPDQIKKMFFHWLNPSFPTEFD